MKALNVEQFDQRQRPAGDVAGDRMILQTDGQMGRDENVAGRRQTLLLAADSHGCARQSGLARGDRGDIAGALKLVTAHAKRHRHHSARQHRQQNQGHLPAIAANEHCVIGNRATQQPKLVTMPKARERFPGERRGNGTKGDRNSGAAHADANQHLPQKMPVSVTIRAVNINPAL